MQIDRPAGAGSMVVPVMMRPEHEHQAYRLAVRDVK
jgi:hypothetical protein